MKKKIPLTVIDEAAQNYSTTGKLSKNGKKLTLTAGGKKYTVKFSEPVSPAK